MPDHTTLPLTGYSLFWGDTHHNTYMGHRQNPPLEEVLRFAATHLDFYTGAYYTPLFRNAPILPQACAPADGQPCGPFTGVGIEDSKKPEKMAEEWWEIERLAACFNLPGRFVMFPGYEWQGNGRWGDHNVIFPCEGHPVELPDTLPELHRFARAHGALAIPHHIAYNPGHRAPLWRAEDETVSPFAELYSVHGCSETDEECLGLRNNLHMGPGVGGSTYQDALDAGLHIGAIASTDNWANMPGQWDQGLAACLATDLTREALWDAFRARRVYGVTGDRIELDFTLNGHPMGSLIEAADRRAIAVTVRGWDAIDRIELLKNGRVIATHCHQGTWEQPAAGKPALYRLRLEFGWGSRTTEMPADEKHWSNRCRLDSGQFTGWSPGWITRGQGVPELNGDTAAFAIVTRQTDLTFKRFNSTVLEFEADPAAGMTLQLGELGGRFTVADLACRSRMFWGRDEVQQRIQRLTGVTPDIPKRDDVYFHHAWKAKQHRAIPEAGYTARLDVTDDEPLDRETHYRVRVEQRNGQRAWSSPIWVRPTREQAGKPIK
jgi:hypothetical protein